ncbi:rhoptry neck protein 6, putative (RON6) [Plasmodium malariae]|uniref:Rhoptry neck protein 6, putative (RON6) n=1 Tax=Plasmodium malariae TaxID=5858 RepID=A0A1A8X576_PLAMA|nr:rhoptry neck protein 6, putative (RON6) [Plasmodium malariae]
MKFCWRILRSKGHKNGGSKRKRSQKNDSTLCTAHTTLLTTNYTARNANYTQYTFPLLQISKAGEYNICLAQFYQEPEEEDLLSKNKSNKNKKRKKNDMKILGIDTIGALYVLPVPSKKGHS